MQGEHKSRSYLFLISYLLLGYLSFQLHEIGHYKMARVFGLETFFGFNRWQILSESSQFQKLAISVAGPLMTLFLAFFGLALVYRSTDVLLKRIGFMLAIFNSLMALIPNLMFFSWSGDLTWVSYYTGIPEYSIRIPFILIYLATLLLVFKKAEKEFRCAKYIVILFFITIAIIALNFILDLIVWEWKKASLLFQPLFGISAVVILTDVFAFLAFVYVMLVYKRVESDYSV